MVRQDILGGLKLAVSKGESLKHAMITFYNAGYKKEDIEGAARAFQIQRQGQQPQQEQPKEKIQKIKSKKQIKQKPVKTIQRVSGYGKTPPQAQIQNFKKVRQGIDEAIEKLEKIEIPDKKQKVSNKVPGKTQKVSNYEQKPENPKGKLITFFLIFFLLFLLGVLAGVFFFKEELVKFFSDLFG